MGRGSAGGTPEAAVPAPLPSREAGHLASRKPGEET